MRKNSFLYQVAEKITSDCKTDLHKIEVVFPNRRSGRVFQRHLAKQSRGPVWSPHITTIDDFFRSRSRLTVADPLTQLSVLHDVWNEIGSFNEPFEQFYFFGKILISDFDQIDKYLVNPDKLYAHVRELKEVEAAFQPGPEDSEGIRKIVEYFSREHGPGTPGEKFMKVWTMLAGVYREFNRRLREEKLAYSGMVYRELAEKLPGMDFSDSSQYCFVGFNRINRCEDKLFSHLKKSGEAKFYWNRDPYLLNELASEGGKFLKQNLKKFPPAADTGTDLRSDVKEVNLVPVPFQSLEAQMVVHYMKKTAAAVEGSSMRAGVILNDENLLLPLLWALPEGEIPINVSAGLNLIKTPAYDLIRDLITLHEEAAKTSGEFHYRNLEKIFFNPYLPGFYKKWMDAVKQKDERGRTVDLREKVFFTARELSEMMGEPIVTEIVKKGQSAPKLVESLLQLMEYLYDFFNEEKEEEGLIDIKQEIIRTAHQVLMKLRDHLKKWSDGIEPDLLRNMLRDIAQSRRIPFKGEPLSGIQLMGALESRNVSYDHLILPSLNEGIQPSAKAQSFIPFSLKKYFGLPTTDDEMADQSYYFWTLIAGAKTMDILYSEQATGLGRSELSRFVLQMQYGQFIHWKGLEKKDLYLPVDNNSPSKIEIQRTAPIQRQLLKQLEGRGLSPSTFLNYLKCELRFYFGFVLGADDHDDIPEEIDARLMGSIAHKTMEELYRKYKNREVKEEDINDIESQLPNVLRREMAGARRLKGKKIPGHDLVAERYLLKLLKKVISFDRKRTPFTMVNHEEKVEIKMEFKGEEIAFKGVVDRIHRDEKGYRIIDYKTGNDDPVFKKEEGVPEPGNDQEKASGLNSAAIQLLIYCWLLQKQDVKFEKAVLYPEVYSGRNIDSEYHSALKIKETGEEVSTNSDFYRLFTEKLEESLGQMLNPNRSFRQTTDEKVCTYCPFNNICMRQQKQWW